MKYLTRLFLRISVLYVLYVLYSIDSHAQTDILRDTVPHFFDATIEIAGQTISGIIVLKLEEHRCRVLFTPIAGPKLLDMYVSDKNYKIIYVVKKLKKKFILRFLQKDFALLTGLYLVDCDKLCNKTECTALLSKNVSARYFYDSNKRIFKSEYIGKKKTLFSVNYGYTDDCLNSVVLQHHNFNMKIELYGRRL